MAGNLLFYGDNLSVLRENIASESIDLVYLDPPFNSERDYNVLFKEHGTESEAQIRAFEDYWHWDVKAEQTYAELTKPGVEERGIPGRLVTLMESMRQFLGQSDMMAYLVMMAIRLAELRRVLKPAGSLYLHCDPTASHYLKLILDAVFGPTNFKNEIIWRRSHPKGQAFTRFARNHDVILAVTKEASHATWNPPYVPHDPDTVMEQYKLKDKDGRPYQLTSLLNPNPDRPNLTYEFLGVTKVWRWTKERMMHEYEEGHIVVPKGGKGIPRYKRYLDEQEGIPISDSWTDIEFAGGGERLGYPTQKPVALLERIINASSNEGDVVLDPFCGCGTALHAAQKLNRRWIGIDITHLAIGLIRNRLDTAFKGKGIEYEVKGVPADAEGARKLAETDPYQFQWWALPLIGARAVANGEPKKKEGKKGMDRGIDGVIRFLDNPSAARSNRIIVSVKAGKNLGPWMVRDLRGTIEREGAPIGVLLSMYDPSAEMRAEAAKAGVWHSDSWGRDYPRIQLITIADAFAGKRVDYPGRDVTLQAAPTEEKPAETLPLKGMKPRAVSKRKR
ncbi:MAG: DNA methyltransferase [Candidatus Binataceae bacterium]